MSEETTQSTENAAAGAEAGKRPVFLTVICILSFISAGFGLLAYITAIGVATAASAIAGAAGAEMGAEMGAAMESVGTSAGMTWAYIIVGFLTTIVGLIGVIKMWKLKKQGFMLYAGSSVVSIIMGIIYSGFGIGAVIFPVLFIVLYYLNLKHMN